jgi:hypothetical protein
MSTPAHTYVDPKLLRRPLSPIPLFSQPGSSNPFNKDCSDENSEMDISRGEAEDGEIREADKLMSEYMQLPEDHHPSVGL